MTRYLFIGDLHVKTDNREQIDLLLTEVFGLLTEHTYDAIVLGGDILHYHERLFTQPLNQALHFIQSLSTIAKVYVLVGNHDYINNSQFLTRNHWLNALKTWNNVVIVDRALEEEHVLFLPYVPPGRLVEAMETVTKRWNYKEVIFCHQEFRGCKMGAITSVEGDEWDDEYPLVISGHIHDHQLVGKKVVYPGTPLQHGFGDSTIRRLCDITVKVNSTSYDWIDLNMPRKHIIHCDINSIHDVLDQKIDHVSERDKIKVKLESTPEQFAMFKQTSQYKQLLERGVRFQIKAPSSSSSDDAPSPTTEEVHFMKILEKLSKSDEPIVYQLFQEVVMKKI